MSTQTPLGEFDESDLEPQVMSVRVTNRNDFTIRDRFDGVPYEFEPNKPKAVPIDAAHHIFGWHPPIKDEEGNEHPVDPVAMRLHVVRRFGWNTPDMQVSGRNDIFYNNLEIVPVMYRMVPVPVEPEEEVQARRAPKTNKLMAAAGEAAARG